MAKSEKRVKITLECTSCKNRNIRNSIFRGEKIFQHFTHLGIVIDEGDF